MSSLKPTYLCLVSSLCVGGAEKHTVTLANLLNPRLFNVHLGYLKPVEALLSQVSEEVAERTFCLRVAKRVDFRRVMRLRTFIDSHEIDVNRREPQSTRNRLYALMATRCTRAFLR